MPHDLLFTDDSEWYAADLRAVYEIFDEGVLADGLEVTSGLAFSIDVGAGVAFVQGDDDPDQGLYRVLVENATNSEAFPSGGLEPADPDDPRVDRIVARVYDDAVDASGQTAFRLEVLTGAPTAGATLGNLNGAVAVPPTTLLLANVLVEAGDAAIDPANIDDERPDALGGIGGGGGAPAVHGESHEHGESDPIASLPTSDQKAAMDNAATPATAANPFLTEADAGSGGGGGGSLTIGTILDDPGNGGAGFHENIESLLLDWGEGFSFEVSGPTAEPGQYRVFGEVLERPMLMRRVEVTTALLADDAIEDVLFDFETATIGVPWGTSGGVIARVIADAECRVRLYGTAADRTADAARAVGVDPTGDHGVYLDLVTTPTLLSIRPSPMPHAYDWDAAWGDPTDAGFRAAITNLSGAAAAITVQVDFFPILSGLAIA